MTRAELAKRLERELGPLASDAGWKVTGTSGQTEGQYTDAIADALELTGVADLTTATVGQRMQIRQLALGACLARLERHYAALVDTVEGPVSQKLSQVRLAIAELRKGSSAASGRQVVMTTLVRAADEYTLGYGTVTDETLL